MNHQLRLLSGVFLLVGLASMATASADENRGAWFKSLRQPITGGSCCDMADCARTDADWRGGQWWAVVFGKWTPIPPDRELSKKSIDGEAYVCSSPNGAIYCFVKPTFGT